MLSTLKLYVNIDLEIPDNSYIDPLFREHILFYYFYLCFIKLDLNFDLVVFIGPLFLSLSYSLEAVSVRHAGKASFIDCGTLER